MTYKRLKQFRILILIISILLILISSKKLNTTSLLQKKEVYDSNDKLLKTINYKYNFKNKIIKENYEYTDKSDFVYYKGYFEFKYNLNGTLKSKIEYSHLDKLLQAFYYKYDSQQKLIEYIWYDDRNLPFILYKYSYDSNGNIEKESSYPVYNSIGQFQEYAFTDEYEYKNEMYISIEPMEYWIYNYDDNNYLISKELHGFGGYTRVTYEYNDNLLIKFNYIYKGESKATTYEYNKNGDLIRENKYDEENNLEEYYLYYY